MRPQTEAAYCSPKPEPKRATDQELSTRLSSRSWQGDVGGHLHINIAVCGRQCKQSLLLALCSAASLTAHNWIPSEDLSCAHCGRSKKKSQVNPIALKLQLWQLNSKNQ
eukprot:5305488-Amphidinium_carterae.1